VHAPDGKTGVERAALVRPDIVLLDMQLPDMTGIEVVRLLRTTHETCGSRVVALSASAMLGEVEQARLHGCDGYWTKPLDFKTFLADVSAELAQLDASERVLSASGH
jgi:CheY-like chemotaxis protein